MFDFVTADHGSVIILVPVSAEARDWVDDHIDPNAPWFARGVAVEPRYIDAILDGIAADGLTIN